MKKLFFAVFGAFLCLSTTVRADEALFAEKGSWTMQTYGTYIRDFGDSAEELGAGTLGLGYYFWDDVAVNLELVGYGVDQGEDDTGAGGLNTIFRWHFLGNEDWTVYIDGGGGLFQAAERVPEGGTHFNFTAHAGFGVTRHLWDNVNLMGGSRWFHLSNANRRGADRNPSIDAYAIYLGLMFNF